MEPTTVLTPVEVQLKKIAYCLGILQGLAYAILGVMCIILYNQSIRYFSQESYMDYVNQYMYAFFLGPEDNPYFHQSLRPGVFAGFVWVHFILHLGWLGISVESLRRDKVVLPKYLFAWSHLTLVICLWDFITVVIIGTDYKKCLNWADSRLFDSISTEAVCANGILPVLVIAAKGFVLWVVNVCFAVYVHLTAKKLKQAVQQMQQPTQAPFGVQPQFQPQPQVHPQPRPQYPVQPNVYQQPPYVQRPQNANNQFNYPVPIPDPDYHNEAPYSPAAKY